MRVFSLPVLFFEFSGIRETGKIATGGHRHAVTIAKAGDHHQGW